MSTASHAQSLPAILKKGVGIMTVAPAEKGVDVFIREDKMRIQRLPRPCGVELRLPHWDCPPVIAVCLLARLGHKEHLTYQHWFHGGSTFGIRTLQQLAYGDHVPLHLVAGKIERTLTAVNTLRADAARLVELLSQRIHVWSDSAHEEARSHLDRLYPSPRKLWQEQLRRSRTDRAAILARR